jgi:hypothetical protein
MKNKTITTSSTSGSPIPAKDIPAAVEGARMAKDRDDMDEWLDFVFGQDADPAAVARVDKTFE